jgi:hypothetical protein
MNTAHLYQKIISIIQQSFIEPAERFGLSVVELKALDPSIDELVLHLKGLRGILKLFANDNHSEINMAMGQALLIQQQIIQIFPLAQ